MNVFKILFTAALLTIYLSTSLHAQSVIPIEDQKELIANFSKNLKYESEKYPYLQAVHHDDSGRLLIYNAIKYEHSDVALEHLHEWLEEEGVAQSINCEGGCPEGQDCVNGKCKPSTNDCAGGCPDGTQCIGGKCKPDGNCGGGCPAGQHCIGGKCKEKNDCLGGCPAGEVCIKGKCGPVEGIDETIIFQGPGAFFCF